MLNQAQISFLTKAYQSAVAAGHIWPGAAAAECALESSWGTSKLCRLANNLFGLKKPSDWKGPTISIPTREFLKEQWVTVPAVWPVFVDWPACFEERMRILTTRSAYALALAATSPVDFIIDVSSVWSTGPERAEEVLSIYNHHRDILK